MATKVFVAGWILLLGAIVLVIVYAPLVRSSVDASPDPTFEPEPTVPDLYLTESELKSDTRVALFKAKINKTLDQVKQTSKQLNIEYVGSETFSPTEGRYRGDKITGLSSHELTYSESHFLSSQFEGWRNAKYRDLLQREHGDIDKKYIPKWNSDEVLLKAKAFLQSFDDLAGLQLEEPEVKGIDNEGIWEVDWKRRDFQGHPYHNNWIIMTIRDNGGLIEVRSLITFFEPSAKVSYLSEKDASTMAHNIVASTHSTGSFTLSEGSLEIVVGKTGPCLAWIFSIREASNTTSESPTIFIDAQTGQKVGGENWL